MSRLKFLKRLNTLYIFKRIPKTETTYNNAKAICEATSGSLVRVDELKHLDWKTIQNSIKFPIFRLDALKGTWNNISIFAITQEMIL